MKFLCLAYGDQEGWDALSKHEKNELLARDEQFRKQGNLVASVDQNVTTVRAWDGTPHTTHETVAQSKLPLAGFGIIDAFDEKQIIGLVAGTPCARANGAIEIRAITQVNNLHSKQQIKETVDKLAEAIRSKNVEATLIHYAPEVVSFDVVGPLQYRGLEAMRKRLEEWFSSFHGPIQYENRDMEIAISDTVAFCHSLNHVSGNLENGRKLEMWWRATLAFRKNHNTWLVAHSHSSVLFDPATGKASLGLLP